MKRSHLQTPRTMRDCQFDHWAEPIEYEPTDDHNAPLTMLLIGVVICIAAIVIFAAI